MVLLAIFLVLVPYTLYQTSYILAAACVLALAYRLLPFQKSECLSVEWRRFAWLFAPMAVIYLLDLVGMLYTPVPEAGAKILERNLSFVAFPALFLLLGPAFFTAKRLKIFGFTLCFSCIVMVSLFFVNLAMALNTNADLQAMRAQHQWASLINVFVHNPYTYLGEAKFAYIPHHTFQAWYMLVAMSVIVYTWAVYPDWYRPLYRKIISILLLVLYIGVGIVLAMSKMGWIVFVFWCMMTIIFLLVKKKYKAVASGTALTLSLVIAFLLAFSSIGHLAERTYRVFSSHAIKQDPAGDMPKERDSSVYPRLLLWKEAMQGIKEKPLFGWGTAGEKAVLHPDQHGLGSLIQDPHNQWLLLGIRFGMVGLLAFVWLWFVGFRHACRTKNSLLLIFLLISLCFTATDRTLDIQQGITFFCMSYGLLTAFSQYTLIDKTARNKF